MDGKHSLSATNLATYQHLNCDLYIHNVYNGSNQGATDTNGTSSPSELTKAQCKRGLDWETSLYSWLDRSQLLLKVPSMPLEASSLLENIQADDRSHFFINGLNFWPPQVKLAERFARVQTEPFNFSLAKPDLLEITRTKDGVIRWRVLDAKASKYVKTSHHIQIYFYTLCLKYLLGHPFYHSDDSAGIWLSPKDGFHTSTPSFEDIKTISISLLAPAFDTFLFEKLPRILSRPYERVKWHYNPLCHGCKYEPECRPRVQKEGGLGSIPNISIDDGRVLEDLLRVSRVSAPFYSNEKLTDIEQLHDLFAMPRELEVISRKSPALVKKSKRILAIPRKCIKRGPILSPLVEAARENEIQVIPRMNYTCPSREYISIIISIVHDPSSSNPGGALFCLTTHSQESSLPSFVCGSENDLIPRLAVLIRAINALQHTSTTQFYVWSTGEQSLLQSHMINSALSSSTNIDDIRICIGALAQGASLLQTTFQPLVLSGALLAFLGKGKRTKAEYKACLERMRLPTEGTVEDLRKRIDDETRRLRDESTTPGKEDRQKEFGQLQRVVILKKEIERQLALPIPGYWDLPECASILLSSAVDCPSDEEIFMAYKEVANDELLVHLLARRNQCIYSVLQNLRARAVSPDGRSLLVNEGRRLSTRFLDICTEPHLRKLFFMQQFEVLAKLTDLWQSRIDGCPDAPILEYRRTRPSGGGMEYEFRLLYGSVEVPPTGRDMTFYDKLLVLDTTNPSMLDGCYDTIPAEALFDDLGLSGSVFPLNRSTKPNWLRQNPRVQREVLLADVRNILTDKRGHETLVVLRVWGTSSMQFEEGAIYRLSPRLVDFNTTKILSALFELDLCWGSQLEDLYYDEEQTVHHNVPFLQLILDPNSFGSIHMGKEYVKIGNGIQKLFRELKDLNNGIAGSLVLKASQHRATQRILSNRLSIIWGPPGTGKTYTISLSLLRLLEAQRRHGDNKTQIIFITAITHAAIEACRSKLLRHIDAYSSIDSLPTHWLRDVKVELVTRGSDHPPPKRERSSIQIYVGTIYQLYNFTKSSPMEVDCVIVDEAGQISLGAVSLIVRSLSPNGRIVIAGDSEQLAPILSGQYPQLKSNALFGSVLDCLMFSKTVRSLRNDDQPMLPSPSPQDDEEIPSFHDTVVQLTENFRLNPDLGEFVSMIYSRRFKPQKVQARQLAAALSLVASDSNKEFGIEPKVLEPVQKFLTALSDVMYRRPQRVLTGPEVEPVSIERKLDGTLNSSSLHRPVSLALLRLKTWSSTTDHIAYELHVNREAALAAALVASLQRCSPDDDIFVATPHRIQREAVKAALSRVVPSDNLLGQAFERLQHGPQIEQAKVTVDTIERLQGSEAAFVICLFSLPHASTADLGFLLERRRLNVAISRAKTLCILISSQSVLCPSMKVLVNEETTKGYAFLKAFEKRAWSYDIPLNVDHLL